MIIVEMLLFKHLSLGFYRHRPLLAVALRAALQELVPAGYEGAGHELAAIAGERIIAPGDSLEPREIPLRSAALREAFGDSAQLFLTENQRVRLDVIRRQYPTPEDHILRLAYRLRPANMCRRASYSKRPERAGQGRRGVGEMALPREGA